MQMKIASPFCMNNLRKAFKIKKRRNLGKVPKWRWPPRPLPDLGLFWTFPNWNLGTFPKFRRFLILKASLRVLVLQSAFLTPILNSWMFSRFYLLVSLSEIQYCFLKMSSFVFQMFFHISSNFFSQVYMAIYMWIEKFLSFKRFST